MSTRKTTAETAACVICGGTDIERNHVGGRNHIAWLTMPLCVQHHRQFHDLLRAAGVNLEFTEKRAERLIRALKAMMVSQWILTEALENEVEQ